MTLDSATHSLAVAPLLQDVIAKSGLGSWVTTSDGSRYLDMTSGETLIRGVVCPIQQASPPSPDSHGSCQRAS